MPSVDRTMEQALADMRDEIARSTPMPEWTVLVASPATAEEIEAAQRSLAAIRAVADTLATITNRRRLTLRQRRARAIFKEHDPIVRAFAERYTLRVLPDYGHGETTYPWSGDLESDRPYHVEQRLREPEESGGLILWRVVHPGDLSEETLAVAEAEEARRKRAVEGYRDEDAVSDDATAPITAPSSVQSQVQSPPPEPPMSDDELRRRQARESFERQTGEWGAKTWRGCDHAPSADAEFKQARREGRVRVRGVDFFGSTTPRGRR